MYHFFVDPGQIGPTDIAITGSDVNHIRNVLRMQPGEQITVSSGEDEKEYRCEIRALSEEEVTAHIMWVEETGAETSVPHQLCFRGFQRQIRWSL